MKHSLTPLLLSLLAIVLTIPPTVSVADDSLVIYSGRSDKFVKPVVAEFTRQTGIKVTLHTGKSTALLNKLRIEGKRTDADLFLSNDAGNLQRGSEWGLFRAIDSALLAPIDKTYRAANHRWVGLSARARVLVVNTQGPWPDQPNPVFDPAPPPPTGKLGITNRTNATHKIIRIVTAMYKQAQISSLVWSIRRIFKGVDV